ncbi:MAG TPA: YigZ family protein [Nitrosopumilaceae archaeon]|jgi:uncharacterized YigZ family protein|nr:YigZ family protein [Nitrosopumilaceae archaeon]
MKSNILDTYWSIQKSSEGLYKDKGSKFISLAFPVKKEEDIKLILLQIRKEHSRARHHCYAYRLGADKINYKSNDDGEPNNTAGKPILGQILSKDLTNILIVVVRYFGGTLLGVGGLITAYKESAANALYNATCIECVILCTFKITFNFVQTSEVMKILKMDNCNILQQKFDTISEIKFEIRKSISEKIERQLNQIPGISLTFISVG